MHKGTESATQQAQENPGTQMAGTARWCMQREPAT